MDEDPEIAMNPSSYRFNRMELAGSLGDLGTILPLAIGMILINGLNPLGFFMSFLDSTLKSPCRSNP
jgi:hypothetical protein